MVAALAADAAANRQPVKVHILHVLISPAGEEPPVKEVRAHTCRQLRRFPDAGAGGTVHAQAMRFLAQRFRASLASLGEGCSWQAHILQLHPPIPWLEEHLLELKACALLRRSAELCCSGGFTLLCLPPAPPLAACPRLARWYLAGLGCAHADTSSCDRRAGDAPARRAAPAAPANAAARPGRPVEHGLPCAPAQQPARLVPAGARPAGAS